MPICTSQPLGKGLITGGAAIRTKYLWGAFYSADSSPTIWSIPNLKFKMLPVSHG